uniref:histidine phosphatase family protein n=1 Tax=Thaumasiovibrio occultus TaxID=1891184 RepID=UPI00131C9668|nr:alpha-ribazole phosphatase family protein [Thaumasiovibrio occultus]
MSFDTKYISTALFNSFPNPKKARRRFAVMTTRHFYLLRHGLPEGAQCLRGKTDFALTSQGFAQMQAAISSGLAIDAIYTSPLMRCTTFAMALAKQRGCPLETLDSLAEMDFGDWDGMAFDELYEQFPDELERFWRDPWGTTPPNGEKLSDFDLRVANTWRTITNSSDAENTLIVTHSGFIKQLLRQLLQMPKNALYLQRISLNYAAKIHISVFTDEHGKTWPTIQWSS